MRKTLFGTGWGRLFLVGWAAWAAWRCYALDDVYGAAENWPPLELAVAFLVPPVAGLAWRWVARGFSAAARA